MDNSYTLEGLMLRINQLERRIEELEVKKVRTGLFMTGASKLDQAYYAKKRRELEQLKNGSESDGAKEKE
jgi:hypothetical protein